MVCHSCRQAVGKPYLRVQRPSSPRWKSSLLRPIRARRQQSHASSGRRPALRECRSCRPCEIRVKAAKSSEAASSARSARPTSPSLREIRPAKFGIGVTETLKSAVARLKERACSASLQICLAPLIRAVPRAVTRGKRTVRGPTSLNLAQQQFDFTSCV